MPEGFSSPEMPVRIAVDKKAVAPDVIDPIQAAREKGVREKIKKDKPDATAAIAQEQTLGKEQSDRTIEQNIGWQRGPDGKMVRTPEEQARVAEAKAAQDLAKKLLETGYDGLSAPEKTSILNQAREAVLSIPNTEWFNSLTAPQQQQVLENLIKNPRFAVELSRKNNEAMSQKITSELLELTLRDKSLREKNRDLQRGLRAIQAEERDVRNQLVDFESTGASAIELATLKADMPTIRLELSEKNIESQGLTEEIRTLRETRLALLARGRDTSPIDAEISARQAELTALRTTIATREARVRRYEELISQKEDLTKKQVELEEAKIELQAEIADVAKENVLLKAQLEDSRQKRLVDEQEYVAAIKSQLKDAMRDMIISDIQEAEVARDDLYKEAAENEKDPAIEAIEKQNRERWDRQEEYGTFKKKTRFVLNKEQIRIDYEDCLQNGPDGIIINMLQQSGFTPDQINAKMLDQVFVKEARALVAERLITRKLQEGALTSGDARRIVDSEWGKEMIDKAIANKKEYKEVEEKLRREGNVKDATIGEWLRRQKDESILKFLLLLLGFGVLGATPLYFLAKNSQQR